MAISRGTKKPAARASKKGGIAVDFSDTETQKLITEGDYQVEVVEVEQGTSQADQPKLDFQFHIVEDEEFNGKKLYHTCSLQPQALFNLRGLLEALGMEVPQGTMELDPADLIGLQCGVHVFHEVYEGKTKAKIAEFFPLGEEEEEAPAPKAKAAAKPAAKAAVKEAPASPAKKVVKKKKDPVIEVDSVVTFTDEEGNEISGTVTSLGDGTADVDVEGEIWEIGMEDLTLAE